MSYKTVVLGGDGMLGHMVVKALKRGGRQVKGYGRDMFEVEPTSEQTVGVKLNRVVDEDDVGYVINCVGAIKPMFKTNLTNCIYTNAVFPHQLASVCEKRGLKLIHITTDCVFDGLGGPYDETREHNATDDYGKSKSLGEPSNCLVLRTSIIGPEVGGRKRSLLEWVRSQDGKEINGFDNHLWNGVTTLELGRRIATILNNGRWEKGTFHIYSTDITKRDLLGEIIEAYKLNIKVNPINAPAACDRRLRSIKDLKSESGCPRSIKEQLQELASLEKV